MNPYAVLGQTEDDLVEEEENDGLGTNAIENISCGSSEKVEENFQMRIAFMLN